MTPEQVWGAQEQGARQFFLENIWEDGGTHVQKLPWVTWQPGWTQLHSEVCEPRCFPRDPDRCAGHGDRDERSGVQTLMTA